MRALVTGGAGFIGSTLVDRLLAEGHTVDVLDDLSSGRLDNLADARREARSSGGSELRIHQLDIRQPGAVELIVGRAPEVVFHLAARHHAADVEDAEVTVIGTLRVLAGATQAGARKVVFASTAAVYGAVDDAKLPIRESQPQRPTSPAAVAKRAAAEYLTAAREVDGLEFSALALGTVYGPRQVWGPVPAFAAAALERRPAHIDGDGEQTLDLVFVDDAVDALVRAAEKGNGLFVNIGTGRETSVRQLHDAVAELAGSDVPPEHGPPRPGERRRCVLDAGRARIHLGWSPWTTLEDGIAQTLRATRG